jgi:hypothetical protein
MAKSDKRGWLQRVFFAPLRERIIVMRLVPSRLMDTAEDINHNFACPGCGSAMVAGVVVGRSPGVKFKPHTDILGDLGGITLTRGLFNHSAEARRCVTCGIVVILPEG